MSWVTWLTWPPCPYMVKTLKNLLLQNQLTDDLETGYVALCMWVLPRLFKLWPWVDLDLFYAKVKFGHIGFCMGKIENYLFFRNYCSLGSQSCLKHSAKWVHEVGWVSKVKVILWPWSKVTQISKSKTVGRFGTKVHMKAWRRIGMKINTNELGDMTNMAAMPIYGKNLKKS